VTALIRRFYATHWIWVSPIVFLLFITVAVTVMSHRDSTRAADVKQQLMSEGYDVVSVIAPEGGYGNGLEGSAVLKSVSGATYDVLLYRTAAGYTPYLLCPIALSGEPSSINCTSSPP